MNIEEGKTNFNHQSESSLTAKKHNFLRQIRQEYDIKHQPNKLYINKYWSSLKGLKDGLQNKQTQLYMEIHNPMRICSPIVSH